MKVVGVVLPIWKWNGCVIVGGTYEQFAAWAKANADIDILEGGPNSAGHAYVEYGKPWVMWVQSLKNAATLAHEAFHITSGVLEGRGVQYSRESEEAYTYTLEYIIQAVLTSKHWRKI